MDGVNYFANWGFVFLACQKKGFCLGFASAAGIMSSGPPALPHALLVPQQFVQLCGHEITYYYVCIYLYIYIYIYIYACIINKNWFIVHLQIYCYTFTILVIIKLFSINVKIFSKSATPNAKSSKEIYLTLLLTTCTKAWWYAVVCRSNEKLIDNFLPPH